MPQLYNFFPAACADGRVWQVAYGGSVTITYTYPNEYTVDVVQNALTTTTTADGFSHVIKKGALYHSSSVFANPSEA